MPGKDNNKKLNITIVVAGKPYPDEYPVKRPIHSIVKALLSKTGNTGQPIGNWTLRTEDGRELSFNKTLEEEGIKNNDVLILSVKAGEGGFEY